MDTKKCLCGAPVAKWIESPIARAANLCKPCADIYLSAGMLCEVKPQICQVPELPTPESGKFLVWGEGGFDAAMKEFQRITDSSDDTLSGSLSNAGFGSQGPM